MSASGNNTPKIIVDLIIKSEEFVSQIRKALNVGVKEISSFGPQFKTAFSRIFGAEIVKSFEKSLTNMQVQLTSLSKSLSGIQSNLQSSSNQLNSTLNQQTTSAANATQAVNTLGTATTTTSGAVNQASQMLTIFGQRANTSTNFLASFVKQQQNAASSSSSFGSSLNGLVGFIGKFTAALGFANLLASIINLFKDAGAAALEFAVSQNKLTINSHALGKALGVDGGAVLDRNRKLIHNLRREYAIFSEKEITDAVNSLTVLSRTVGLNSEEQQKVIEVATTLAQTSGVTLTQAIDDVTKALGGSAVVLDKYGVFIRDVDKAEAAFQLGFTEKLQKGTNSLNSQQLALATLETTFQQVQDQVEAVGEVEDSLPVKLKEADAKIQDQLISLGESFADILLPIKEGFANFLALLELAVETTKFLGEVGLTVFGTLGKIIGGYFDLVRENIQHPFDFSKNAENLQEFLGTVTELADQTGKELQSVAQKHAEKIADTILDSEFLSELFGTTDIRNLVNQTKDVEDLPNKAVIDDEAESKFADAKEKIEQEIFEKHRDHVLKLKELDEERNRDKKEADADYLRQQEELNRETQRKFEDLERDIADKREDLSRDFNRKLLDIDKDEEEKREKVLEESNNKKVDLNEDYYQRIRELERAFYSDLRDAVAENDAVAIKKLIRKFNEQMATAEDKYRDDILAEEEATNIKLENLQKETEDRKAELQIRQQQELEDLAISEERKREEILLAQEREMDDLLRNHDLKIREIDDHYRLQVEIARQSYEEQLMDLAIKNAQEGILTDEQFQLIASKYLAYYGEGGILRGIMDSFMQYKQFAQSFEGNPNIDPTGGDYTDAIDRWMVNNPPEDRTQTTTIRLESDGSIPNNLETAVYEQMADVIDYVYRRPGGGMGMQ